MYVTTSLGDRVFSTYTRSPRGDYAYRSSEIHDYYATKGLVKHFLANPGEPLSEEDAADKGWIEILDGLIRLGLIAQVGVEEVDYHHGHYPQSQEERWPGTDPMKNLPDPRPIPELEPPGIYVTVYGNTARFDSDGRAYDLDMDQEIEPNTIRFDKWIGKLEDY